MARIELAPEVFDDFDRIFENVAAYDPGSAPTRIDGILQAIQVLAQNPLIGRPARNGLRELVIGKATRGYLALYRYVAAVETVFVLAIRHQRESGYKHPA